MTHKTVPDDPRLPNRRFTKNDRAILLALISAEFVGLGLVLIGQPEEGAELIGKTTVLLVAQIVRMRNRDNGGDPPTTP